MEKEINQTKYKILFNKLLLESETYPKTTVYWKNGLYFKITPVDNTLLNKHLLRI
ncbi:MAG: hypothetical protein IIA87_03230 [Nanoarchaeota archaeon]|nr:hypothetical protein [Nanoarchaeota archaeon]